MSMESLDIFEVEDETFEPINMSIKGNRTKKNNTDSVCEVTEEEFIGVSEEEKAYQQKFERKNVEVVEVITFRDDPGNENLAIPQNICEKADIEEKVSEAEALKPIFKDAIKETILESQANEVIAPVEFNPLYIEDKEIARVRVKSKIKRIIKIGVISAIIIMLLGNDDIRQRVLKVTAHTVGLISGEEGITLDTLLEDIGLRVTTYQTVTPEQVEQLKSADDNKEK